MSDLIRHFSLDKNTLAKEDPDVTQKLVFPPDEVTERIIAYLNGETADYIDPSDPSTPEVDS